MREISYLGAINEGIGEEMERDPKVYVIGEDVTTSAFGITRGLVQRFGQARIIDTPISETAIAGAAVGAAMTGYRPVADFMFADFMFIAADEILLKAAKWRFIHGGVQRLPLVFMAAMGGYAMIGPEHSQSPEGIFMHTPGLKLAVPATPYDAKGLIKAAIRDDNPVVFLYHKGMLGFKGPVPEEDYVVPLGRAEVKREGSDVTVVAVGMMVHFALGLAEELKDRISVEVVDPRSLEPLDIETIVASVRKTGRVVVADEDTSRCGPAAEIAMQIMEQAFDDLDAPIKRIAAANYPIPAGLMERFVLPQPADLKAAIEALAG
ncbi:MAG: alpha-ketoacid dehydrogenase subunit beta [Proteobacteria bacterium]|nr:alpha-ketoacid dehydrogenase subunit beta [Pseudomonadota bacterium]